MAVYLVNERPSLPDGWEVVSTDWQIANDIEFKNIEVEFLADSNNKYVKVVSTDLDPDKIYYARSRFIFNKNIGEYTDVHTLHPRDIDTLNLTIPIPGVVKSPKIMIDKPLDDMSSSLFTITTSDFSSTGNGSHLYTNYSILDMFGKTVYSNLKNHADKTRLFVDDVVLTPGYSYQLVVSHASDSNDVSNNSFLFFTIKENNIQVKSETYMLDKEEDLVFEIQPLENTKVISYSLYAVGVDTIGDLLSTATTNVTEVTFPKSLLVGESDNFIVKTLVGYINNETDISLTPITFKKNG